MSNVFVMFGAWDLQFISENNLSPLCFRVIFKEKEKDFKNAVEVASCVPLW